MQELIKFINEHINDDIDRLLLNRNKWPETDVGLAADCILSRRKLQGKVKRWSTEENLVCPRPLSAEQCSSDETAAIKAELAEKIARSSGMLGWKIADLTGGLGIDSWYFSLKADAVLYNEMLPILAKAAGHNFRILDATNIKVSNAAVVPTGKEASISGGIPCKTPHELLDNFHPDIIFIDPARRGEGGRKVFLLEDCTPDITGMLDELWECAPHILLKLSPMADITMLAERLGPACREIHVVSSGGECKELLVWMDRKKKEEEKGQSVWELFIHESGADLHCPYTAEKEARAEIAPAGLLELIMNDGAGEWSLFEPGKSLMKAGLFNYISQEFGLYKIGRSTHYYLIPHKNRNDGQLETLEGLGKVMPLKEALPMNRHNLKDLAHRFPHCEVTARNLPISSDELRKKMKVSSGTDAHIYALKTEHCGNLIFIC